MPFPVVGSVVLVLAVHDCAGDEMSVFAFLADRGCLARWAMPASNPTWSAASWRCRFPLKHVWLVMHSVAAASSSVGVWATAFTGMSMSAAWLHLPFEHDDLVVGLVDLQHEEVADDGFWAEVHAMIIYSGRQDVL